MERTNCGYTIIDTFTGEDCEIVLGDNGREFVTWMVKNSDNYFWGHYFNNKIDAKRDYINRAMREIERMEYIHKLEKAARTLREEVV